METLPGLQSEFERLYRAHADAVLAYLVRRANVEDAADAAAATFLVAWRRFGDVPVGRERPWLYGVARRVLADQRRALRRQRAVAARVASEQPLAHFDSDSGVDRQAVVEALATLDDADREVLMLSAWEGLPGGDAALVMECSTVTYRVRLHRARLRLRRALAEGDVERERPRPLAPEAKEN